MRKRLLGMALVIALFFSFSTYSLAATTRQATGNSTLSNSGRNVTFSGYSTSTIVEDVISVTIKLMEQRNGTWYEIDRVYTSDTNTNYIFASDSVTVSGGYYYKVIGIHYSKTGSQITNKESQSPSVWIGA